MPLSNSKTHFNCGHPRTKENSASSGRNGFFKCKICRNKQRKLRRMKVIEPLLKAQSYRCAICGRKLDILSKVCQDHNHKHKRCNRIGGGNGPSGCPKCRRGLLCASCNGSLTLVENKKLLEAAIKYLEYWETQWKLRNIPFVSKET